jgi:hypothetical protein
MIVIRFALLYDLQHFQEVTFVGFTSNNLWQRDFDFSFLFPWIQQN